MKFSTTAKPRICQPGDDSVKIDPEFEGLIPPLSAGELAELHQSLDAEGCRDALVVWQGENLLIDGHNRIRYCREKDLPFPVIEKVFADRDEVKAYIIHAQLGRRNLSPGAESYLRGKRYLESKRQGARTDLTSGQNDQKSTSQKLGEEFSVAEKTIRRDAKFAQAVDGIVANCGPDSRNLILSRDLGLTRGGVLRLSKLKPADQKQFLEDLKTSGKRPRKARKAKKREKTITIPSQPKQLAAALLKQLKPEELAEVSRALAEAMEKQAEVSEEGEGTGRRKRKGKEK